MTDYNQLFQLNELAVKEGNRYPKQRAFYHSLITEKGKSFIGVTGPRGVGKTIILKQVAANTQNALYMSLDTLDEIDLFDTAKTLMEKYGIKLLLLDEIHHLKEYEKQLKKIYDFLDIRIVFSSSVSLSMMESSIDLSRRVRIRHLYPFSFREYIYFKKDFSVPGLTLDDILNEKWTPEHLRYEYLFDDYLRGGVLPFSLEEPDVLTLLENILQKILVKDIPAFAKLRVDEISLMEKMIRFIGRSSVDGINYSSISKNIGITKYKAESYINLLKKAFVLQVVFPTGTNVMRESKVLMSLPFRLLYKDYQEVIGGIREDFAVEMMKMNRLEFYYLKTTRGTKTPDFLVKRDKGDIVVEIGGKGKGREQFKGVKYQHKLIFNHGNIAEGIKRPLFLLGFLGNS